MSNSENGSAYAALRARYAASLITKHRQLAQAWTSLQHDAGQAGAPGELATQLHRLCGSATAYGYPEVGRHACEAERCLRAYGRADQALARAVQALLAAMAAVIAPHDPDDGEVFSVVLLTPGSTPAEWLAPTLRAQGCEVQRVADPAVLWPLLAEMVCHAVVFDARLPHAMIATVVEGVRATPSPLTPLLICWCVEGPAGFRAAALAAGCDAALTERDGVGGMLALIRAAHGRGGPTEGLPPA